MHKPAPPAKTAVTNTRKAATLLAQVLRKPEGDIHANTLDEFLVTIRKEYNAALASGESDLSDRVADAANKMLKHCYEIARTKWNDD